MTKKETAWAAMLDAIMYAQDALAQTLRDDTESAGNLLAESARSLEQARRAVREMAGDGG